MWSAVFVLLAGVPAALPLVVLDAGHGGAQDGAVGICGLIEKDLALAITKELGKVLTASGKARVALTRESDVHLELHDRSLLANSAGATVFISIHGNASTNPAHQGLETYFLSRRAADYRAKTVADRENGGALVPLPPSDDQLLSILQRLALDAAHGASQRLALEVQQCLTRDVAEDGRGVLQAPFVVLHGAEMAAVLVEVGFLTNAQDCAQLAQLSHQRKLAHTLATAVLVFLGQEAPLLAHR